jgi:hypothetical protein
MKQIETRSIGASRLKFKARLQKAAEHTVGGLAGPLRQPPKSAHNAPRP